MREILFRGKSQNSNKWVYGWYCGKTLNHDMSDTEGSSQIIDFKTLYWHTCRPETVGQFTGLTDKNGKKIFEGDILRAWSDYHQIYYGHCVVRCGVFNCSCCHGVYGWCLEDGDIRILEDPDKYSYEVCGNIHDNPELLEVSDGK